MCLTSDGVSALLKMSGRDLFVTLGYLKFWWPALVCVGVSASGGLLHCAHDPELRGLRVDLSPLSLTVVCLSLQSTVTSGALVEIFVFLTVESKLDIRCVFWSTLESAILIVKDWSVFHLHDFLAFLSNFWSIGRAQKEGRCGLFPECVGHGNHRGF